MKHLKWVDWRIVGIFIVAASIKVGTKTIWVDSLEATLVLSGILFFGFAYCTMRGIEEIIKWAKTRKGEGVGKW